ncbi:MAG: SDR family oxidoreductase [Bauldia sp.]|nr:SDR family oxidoreductase [Bauldia sp.]
MFDFQESVALVTGGTRGIGLAIARSLLDEGARVAISGRNATDEAEALRDEAGDDRVLLVLGDVGEPAVARRMVEEAAAWHDRLDILVHSAGGPAPGTMLAIEPETWMSAFDVHVHPVFHMFRAAHPYLARKGGAVLLISSVAGIRGCPGTVAYQTVKGALIPMARALAFDHGPENIRINVLAPGIIRTRFHEAMTDQAKAHNIGSRIPLRREGGVDDVAFAAMQMLGNEFITGEVLTIDGGMSMRVTG